MSERDDDYYGEVKSPFRLDDHGNMVPVKPEPVIVPKLPAVIALPLAPKVIAETHLAAKEAVENAKEKLTEELLESAYIGDYARAYRIASNEGIDASGHPRLFEILEDEIREVMVEGKNPAEDYFELFYLLEGNFNINAIPGLDIFILMVFDNYRDNFFPTSSIKPLRKMLSLFGDQIDFKCTIEELEMELGETW